MGVVDVATTGDAAVPWGGTALLILFWVVAPFVPVAIGIWVPSWWVGLGILATVPVGLFFFLSDLAGGGSVAVSVMVLAAIPWGIGRFVRTSVSARRRRAGQRDQVDEDRATTIPAQHDDRATDLRMR